MSTPNTILMPDTNVLIHCLHLDQIDFRQSVDAGISEVLVSIAVVDELDKLKSHNVVKISRRAASILRKLEQTLSEEVLLRGDIPLRILPDGPDRDRLAWFDDEIRLRCIETGSERSQPVILLTRDLGMRIRADTKFKNIPGLRAVKAPDSIDEPISEKEKAPSALPKSPKLVIGFEAATHLLKPRPYVAGKLLTVDEIVRRADEKAPQLEPEVPRSEWELTGMSFGPTYGQRRDFLQDRGAWKQKYTKWAQALLDAARLLAAAVPLDALQIVNTGGLTASDIEIRLAIDEAANLRFALWSDLQIKSLPNPPRAPEPPVSPMLGVGARVPNLTLPPPVVPKSRYDWSFNKPDNAIITVEQIRPNRVPLILEDICIVPSTGDRPVMEGFEIAWSIYAAAPEYEAQGVLQILPREIRE